jgi:hypothetical protein
VSDPTQSQFPPDLANVTCPQCRFSFTARVHAIVDGSDDELRRLLVTGRLNVAQCPQCGTLHRAALPLLYHDADKEAAFVLLPEGFSVARDEQERAIGRLTNRVLESLPPEQRKMYLLQPQTFIVEQTFVDTVLESTGVSRDELERARARGRLIERLLTATGPDHFASILGEADAGSEYELLLLIRALLDDALTAGDEPRAKALAAVQQQLTAHVGEPELSFDDLLRELDTALGEDRLDSVVAILRPALDYAFFAELTNRMETADKERAEALHRLRTALLDSVDRIDAGAKEEVEAAVDLLKWVLQSRHPKPALESREEEITSAFFLVLQANIQAATEKADPEITSRLEAIYQAAVELVEARMTPRERLVNELARTAEPEARRSLLAAASEPVDEALVDLLRETAAEARHGGVEHVAQNLDAAAEHIEQQLELSAPSQ